MEKQYYPDEPRPTLAEVIYRIMPVLTFVVFFAVIQPLSVELAHWINFRIPSVQLHGAMPKVVELVTLISILYFGVAWLLGVWIRNVMCRFGFKGGVQS